MPPTPERDNEPTPGEATLIRPGDIAVFAHEWWWKDAASEGRPLVGFVGILADVWHGWMVFRCTRDVLEAIISEHHHSIDRERSQLRSRGYTGDDLQARITGSTTGLWLNGTDLIVDERGLRADPHAITRTGPDHDGCYIVHGYDWPWIAVEPADCDRIIGQWPPR